METAIAIALKVAGSKLGRTLLIGAATAALSAGLGGFFTHKVVSGNEAALTEQLNAAKDKLSTAEAVNASNEYVIQEYARQKEADDVLVADVQAKQVATEQSLNEARAQIGTVKDKDDLAGPDWDHLFSTITKGKTDARPKTVPKPRPKPAARAAHAGGPECRDLYGVVPCDR